MHLSRRQTLKTLSCGFGYTAFSALASQAAGLEIAAGNSAPPDAAAGEMAARSPHFPATAKRVIFMFMRGGPSQMDMFDYKPELNRADGKSEGKGDPLFGSPYKFAKHGESGMWFSELMPELATCADDLCMIHSMQTDSSAHPLAMPQMHTGSFQFTRPSMGSWVLYGLGTENEDLPGFVTLNPSRVFGGPANFGSAFLPAAYQGARIGWEGKSLKNAGFRNVTNSRMPASLQREQLRMMEEFSGHYQDSAVDGVIESFELGARMQAVAPQVMDLADESEETLKMYGINDKMTDTFGRQCLLARRFAEAGVRFIELGDGSWDHHRNLRKGLPRECEQTDRPMAALLKDLKQRGMLDDTLVIWGGEFGRLPNLQYDSGRGHNADGFTMWMAGGGVKGGHVHGATDPLGRRAVDGAVHLHDLHATMLHLLGLDHERLTYRYGGRDFRLTDVHGNVVHPIIA